MGDLDAKAELGLTELEEKSVCVCVHVILSVPQDTPYSHCDMGPTDTQTKQSCRGHSVY